MKYKIAKNREKSRKIAKNCYFHCNFPLVKLDLIKTKNPHNIDSGFISDKTCYYTEIRGVLIT